MDENEYQNLSAAIGRSIARAQENVEETRAIEREIRRNAGILLRKENHKGEVSRREAKARGLRFFNYST